MLREVLVLSFRATWWLWDGYCCLHDSHQTQQQQKRLELNEEEREKLDQCVDFMKKLWWLQAWSQRTYHVPGQSIWHFQSSYMKNSLDDLNYVQDWNFTSLEHTSFDLRKMCYLLAGSNFSKKRQVFILSVHASLSDHQKNDFDFLGGNALNVILCCSILWSPVRW